MVVACKANATRLTPHTGAQNKRPGWNTPELHKVRFVPLLKGLGKDG